MLLINLLFLRFFEYQAEPITYQTPSGNLTAFVALPTNLRLHPTYSKVSSATLLPDRQNIHSQQKTHWFFVCPLFIYLSLGSLFSIEFSVPHTCYSLLCKNNVLYVSDQHCLLTDPAPPGSPGLPHISKLCHLHNYTVKHYWMTASQRFIFRFIFLLTVSAGT